MSREQTTSRTSKPMAKASVSPWCGYRGTSPVSNHLVDQLATRLFAASIQEPGF
jgi:hypothetical protein